MDGRDFITMVLIVFLSLWGALYLEVDLTQYFVAELFIIFLFIISAIGILYGLAKEEDWAWPSTSLFFIAALINCIFVYIYARNTTPFIVTSVINIVGIGAGVSKLMNKETNLPELPPMPEEERIYHIDEAELVDHIDFEEDDLAGLETFNYEEELNQEINHIAGKKKTKKNLVKPGKKKTKKKR